MAGIAQMYKIPLSGSTHGRGIKVTTVGPIDGSDTAIHTAAAGAALGEDYDQVTIEAYNDDTVARTLYLGWGGTSIPDDQIIQSIPAQSGLYLVTADEILRNSLAIVASASVANKIVIFGHVIRADYP